MSTLSDFMQIRTKLELSIGDLWKKVNDLHLILASPQQGSHPHMEKCLSALAEELDRLQADLNELRLFVGRKNS